MWMLIAIGIVALIAVIFIVAGRRPVSDAERSSWWARWGGGGGL